MTSPVDSDQTPPYDYGLDPAPMPDTPPYDYADPDPDPMPDTPEYTPPADDDTETIPYGLDEEGNMVPLN